MPSEIGLLSRNYPLARKVIAVLGKRLRFLCEQIGNLMVCDVTTRLIKLLVYLAYDNIIDLETCVTPITLPLTLTQEQMAGMTGSCQQTVSETLKKLQADGFIEVSRKEIVLLRPSQLFSQMYN